MVTGRTQKRAILRLCRWSPEHLAKIIPNDAGTLSGVDTMPQALCFVVRCDRTSLLVERVETLAQRFYVVIGPLDKRLAGDIIRHRFFRRTM